MTTRILATFKALAAGSVFGLFAIIATLTITSTASTTLAGELDKEVVNEQALRAKDLPGTVVVRVNDKGEASVLETSEKLNQDANTLAAVHTAKFKSIATAATSELNRDSGAASWFAYYPNYGGYYGRNYGYAPSYYAPVYYSGGYSYAYSNCYQYNYYGYAYYWYRW